MKRNEHGIPTPGIVRAGWYLLVELTERERSAREIVERANRLYPFAAGNFPWLRALSLLIETGFASKSDKNVVRVNRPLERAHSPVDLLTGVLLARPPAWLLIAETSDDKLTLRRPYGRVPEDDTAALQDWGLLDSDCITIPSPARPFWLQLLASVQAPGLTDQPPANDGVEGEEAIVAAEKERLTTLGHPDLAEQVTRVSVISDGYGYDVRSYFGTSTSRWDPDDELHIEVKSTVAPIRCIGDFRLFLTRHEFEVSRRDQSWVLGCWAPDEVGWPVYVAKASLMSCVPEDVARGKWQLAKMRVALRGGKTTPTAVF